MIKRSIYLLFFVLLLVGTFSCVQSSKEKKKKKSNENKVTVSKESANNFIPDSTEEGKALFIQYCSACHGNDGKKGLNGAKDLTITNKSLDKIIKRVNEGKGNMPSFKETLTDQQMIDIANYIESELKPE